MRNLIFAVTLIFAGPVFAEATVRCQGNPGFFVSFAESFDLMRAGPVGIDATDLALARSEATVGINPVFHNLQINVQTAYCAYHFAVDPYSGAFFGATQECEGQYRQLNCQIE